MICIIFLNPNQPSQLGLQNTPTASLQFMYSKIPPPNECPEYDIKQSDGKALALEIWRM